MRATIFRAEEHRRTERFEASRDAEVEVVGDDVYPAVLMDLSETGFRAMVDGHLQPQSAIWIKVGDFPVLRARVVWVQGTVLGGEFADAIGSDLLGKMLRRPAGQDGGLNHA